MNDLICRVDGIVNGTELVRDEVRAVPEASLALQRAGGNCHVGTKRVTLDFLRIENESLCSLSTEDHHLVLVQLHGGNRTGSYEVSVRHL